jgi:hypothetical protein
MSFDDDDFFDQELDALLRQPAERLTPPAGSWEQISRRGRRRRWAKAAAGVAAVVVVFAGAVPAVIAVRHNSNNQTLVQAGGAKNPGPVATGVTHYTTSELSGFVPLSVSFVSQNIGFAWGTVDGSNTGAVAMTADRGRQWTRLPNAPAVRAELDSADADGQIRFVSATVGYIFGSSLYVTRNAGQSWQSLPTPGYVDDLEAVNQQAWALVRPRGQGDPAVQLYTATAARPGLTPVSDASGIIGGSAPAGTDSIAVNSYGQKAGPARFSVDVLIGGATFRQGINGSLWINQIDPCGTSDTSGDPLDSALIAASGSNRNTMVAACGYGASGGAQHKVVYTSNPKQAWLPTASAPSDAGVLETLSAGSHNTIVVGDTQGSAQLSTNGGRSWVSDDARPGVQLAFVGFIDTRRIVALSDAASGGVGAFAVSEDSGRSWPVVHTFP